MKANTLKSKFKILIVIGLIINGLGCSTNDYKESVMSETVDISNDYEFAVNSDKVLNSNANDKYINTLPKNLKIIKSATARYKVKNVKEATNSIKGIAHNYDAYISDLRFQNDLYKIENRFTIKVPQQYFDKIMDSVNQVVEFVEYENITTKDVTEEYIDLETRLKTKLEVKGRYESILRKNAKTVEEILNTEEKLRIIQEEIESTQGRLKYLTSKVSYSTIQIDLYEAVDYKEEPDAYSKTFWSKTKEGLSNGWTGIEALMIILINIWPLLIVGLVAFYFIKKRIRK